MVIYFNKNFKLVIIWLIQNVNMCVKNYISLSYLLKIIILLKFQSIEKYVLLFLQKNIYFSFQQFIWWNIDVFIFVFIKKRNVNELYKMYLMTF